MTESDILELWYRALHAEIGVEVVSSNTKQAMARLYKIRAESGDPTLDRVSIRPSPFDPSKLWLVRKRESDKDQSDAQT